MVPRRKIVPEEYKASRSAMSFAGCAGFFRRRNGATVFDLARRDGTKLHKRVLGYDHRRSRTCEREFKDLNFCITTQDN
jgi:hypothetical protein